MYTAEGTRPPPWGGRSNGKTNTPAAVTRGGLVGSVHRGLQVQVGGGQNTAVQIEPHVTTGWNVSTRSWQYLKTVRLSPGAQPWGDLSSSHLTCSFSSSAGSDMLTACLQVWCSAPGEASGPDCPSCNPCSACFGKLFSISVLCFLSYKTGLIIAPTLGDICFQSTIKLEL